MDFLQGAIQAGSTTGFREVPGHGTCLYLDGRGYFQQTLNDVSKVLPDFQKGNFEMEIEIMPMTHAESAACGTGINSGSFVAPGFFFFLNQNGGRYSQLIIQQSTSPSAYGRVFGTGRVETVNDFITTTFRHENGTYYVKESFRGEEETITTNVIPWGSNGAFVLGAAPLSYGFAFNGYFKRFVIRVL